MWGHAADKVAKAVPKPTEAGDNHAARGLQPAQQADKFRDPHHYSRL